MQSAIASLRGTLKNLQVRASCRFHFVHFSLTSDDAPRAPFQPQSSLFQIFNTIVRASPEARDAVLAYFARVITLNNRRAGMQVRCRCRLFFSS